MIDRTNTNIEELEAETRRDNDRRYAFQRMLQATDKVLWRLEEMNRDGVKVLPKDVRSDIRVALDELPQPCQDLYQDTEKVQDALDSVFDIQERLFKLRFPEYGFDEDDDSIAS